jgi:leucyl aminopeptidase
MGSAKTRFTFSQEKPSAIKADGLIVPVFKKPAAKNTSDKNKNKDTDPTASIVWPVTLDKALRADIDALAAEEKFDGSKGKTLVIRQSATNKLGVRRLILLGLGEAGKLQARHWDSNLQKALGALLSLKDAQTVAVLLPEHADAAQLSLETAVSLSVDAVHQATYKSMEAKDPLVNLKSVTLLLSEKASSRLDTVLKQAESLAQARSLVKDLVNHPANLKSTNTLVKTAQSIGKTTGIKVTVQKDSRWIEKNMPCFYTVARGSVATDPPKFITLHYAPKSGKAKKQIAIVGKSVIFDTGGYQVKPGDYMVTMKGDMTGGAVALATMQALAELQPKNIEVRAYLAATPNKIDSDAMIPDSIVDTTCGKKVEIRHTDAEGRLTLIDAVAKAVENKPDEILTIATLTGAASGAVGNAIALMGNNDALRDRVAQAGKSLGEPIQTLDVIEDDFDNIKSKLDGADIINTSQRKNRGAQSAAAFVMSGAPEEMPMAHMDIAGADMTPDEKATGTSVKTVIQYLLNEDSRLNGGAAPAIGTRPSPSGKTTPKRAETKKASGAATPKKAVKAAVKTPSKATTPKIGARKTATAKSATAVKTTKKAAQKAVNAKKPIAAKPAAGKKAVAKPVGRKKSP